MGSSKGKKFKILLYIYIKKKKSDVDQIPKTASQRNKKRLPISNNGFLSGFMTFSFMANR